MRKTHFQENSFCPEVDEAGARMAVKKCSGHMISEYFPIWLVNPVGKCQMISGKAATTGTTLTASAAPLLILSGPAGRDRGRFAAEANKKAGPFLTLLYCSLC
jgi:hypothetical protein